MADNVSDDKRATKLEKQRDRWNAELNKLETRANCIEAEVEKEYERQIERLRSLLRASEKKLAQIRAALKRQIPE